MKDGAGADGLEALEQVVAGFGFVVEVSLQWLLQKMQH